MSGNNLWLVFDNLERSRLVGFSGLLDEFLLTVRQNRFADGHRRGLHALSFRGRRFGPFGGYDYGLADSRGRWRSRLGKGFFDRQTRAECSRPAPELQPHIVAATCRNDR